MIYKWQLNGLDCAHCAGVIEQKVNKLELVDNCSVEFLSKIMTFETNEYDKVKDDIEKIILKREPDIKIEVIKASDYKLSFDGVDCAHCASVIENNINKLNNVNNCRIDFLNKTCSFSAYDFNDAFKSIEEVFKAKEPDSSVWEYREVKSYKLIFNNLDCADCAAKLEDAINKIDGVENCRVDFMSLTCEYACNPYNHIKIDRQIKEIVNKLEPEVIISDKPLEKEDTEVRDMIIRIIAGTLILLMGLFTSGYLSLFFHLVIYVILGYDVIKKAITNILNGNLFDENFLMALATIMALILKEYHEAVAVMLFYQVGETFQVAAVKNSRKSISDLMNIRPDVARVLQNGEFIEVDPGDVNIGDIIEVKPGEKIALDGIIIEGVSSLDTSSLTGESLYRDVNVNDEVISGCVNISGLLKIRVTKSFSDSAVSKILDMVENANSKKTEKEKFITKFAKVYTPIIVVLALIIVIVLPLFKICTLNDAIMRSCSFLVMSCPCALVISIPLGFFSGIGGLSKKGILVKGSNTIEALSKVEHVVMDKTGTLTTGKFYVAKIIGDDECVKLAAYAEANSNHPIALSIVDYYGQSVDKNKIEDVLEIAGHGLVVKSSFGTIYAGNAKLMDKYQISYDHIDEAGTLVYVALDGKYLGTIVIQDKIKDDSKQAISALKKMNVKTYMLTGDSKKVADDVASKLGIDKVYAQCLPDDKANVVKEISNNGTVCFVGDGINDALVLTLSDVGIAMGGLGSDAAIEASDVVIMDDMVSKISYAIAKAKKTMFIVNENIYGAIGVKIIVLLLGLFGYINMWLAIFADVGLAMICILNATRLLKK